MPLRVITFKASDDLIEKLLQASKALGINRSDLIRQAIMKIVSSVNGDRTIICLELSNEELMYLSLIAKDPVVAVKRLIYQSMVLSTPEITLLQGDRHGEG